MEESIPECGALPGVSPERYLDAGRYLQGYGSGLGFGTDGLCLQLVLIFIITIFLIRNGMLREAGLQVLLLLLLNQTISGSIRN
jgi:hypothetical protein